MDPLYNVAAASACLVEEQHWLSSDKRDTQSVVTTPGWQTHYKVEYSNKPASWRLLQRENGDEEVVFTIQGAIEGKNLPPVDSLSGIPQSKYPLLTQSVTLTGLGTAQFESSIDAISQLYSIFHREFPEGKAMPWNASPCSLSEGRTLVLSNRYFTRRSEARSMRSIPFPQEVDPKRVLSNVVNEAIIHTEENEVVYLTRITDISKQYKYQPLNPQYFRVGDIVEAAFSLVVYKTMSNQHILKPMLYSLVLLEGQFSDELAMKRMSIGSFPAPGRSIKRTLAYVVERSNEGNRKKQKHLGPSAQVSPSKSLSSPSQLGVDKMAIE